MTSCSAIADLVALFLADEREPDVVAFVEHLMALAHHGKPLRVEVGEPDTLRVRLADFPPADIALPRARTKLRMVCARLAALCAESLQRDDLFYGGEGVLGWPLPTGGTMPCRLAFMNTPGEQWLSIEAVKE